MNRRGHKAIDSSNQDNIIIAYEAKTNNQKQIVAKGRAHANVLDMHYISTQNI